MAISDSLNSYLTFLILLGPLILARLPRLLASINSFFSPRSSSSAQQPTRRPPIPRSLLILITLHSLYHFYQLVFPAPNLFTLTRSPIVSTFGRTLQARLEHIISPSSIPFSASQPSLLPPQTLALLDPLHSLTSRLLYARFGHPTFAACVLPAASWCRKEGKLDMFFLWGVQKVWESMVEFVGVSIGLGLAGKGDKWRGKAGLGLSLLVVGEAVWVWFGEVQAGHGIALFDKIQRLHHLAYLFLFPLSMVFLPSNLPLTSVSPHLLMPALIPKLDTLLQTLKLLELSHLSTARNPVLREKFTRVGEVLEKEGRWGRESREVVEEGERRGLTGEEGVRGGLRESARAFIEGAGERVDGVLQQAQRNGP